MVGDTVNPRCNCARVAGTLAALAQQIAAPPMEIIVPYHARVDGIEELKQHFPSVTFLFVDPLRTRMTEGGGREHHDELRARAALVARGDVIAFLEDHVRPDARWCERVVEAHRLSYAVIGGAVENGLDRSLNWAAYFCDLGKYQNPVPGGAALFASLVNASYKRAALDAIRPLWQERFNETMVNRALISLGEKIALSRLIVVSQYQDHLRLRTALKEFFIWGRSFAATRSNFVGAPKRIIYAALSPALPALLLLRMVARIATKRRRVWSFAKAFPLAVLLTTCWAGGELLGYFSSLLRTHERRAARAVAESSRA